MILKDKIKSSIQRIEKYKKDLQEDYILVETTLNILEYLLSEDITHDQRKSLFDNINNTTKTIEEKINKQKTPC